MTMLSNESNDWMLCWRETSGIDKKERGSILSNGHARDSRNHGLPVISERSIPETGGAYLLETRFAMVTRIYCAAILPVIQ